MTYEYDEIITAKDVLSGKVKKEDIIGKEGWLLDCIPRDMSLNIIARLGVHVCLTEIDLDSTFPFGDGGISFIYFLPEKEESATGTVIEEIGEKSYEERQDEWLKANDIAGGDKVRIVRRAESHEDGWDNTWPALMDDDVGKVGFVVEDNGDKGIVVDTENGHRSYPYFVLEKVKDEPETEKSATKRRTWLEDIAYRLYECMHTRYVAFCEQDDYLTVSGFTCKPCFSEENGIWYPGKSEKWSMYDLNIPDAAYSDCPEEWKVDGKVDFSKAIIDMEADDRPATAKRAEDAPEYVPFDLSDPKDRDFLRGKWVRSKNPDVFNEFEIAHFVRINNTNQDIKVETSGGCTYFAGELLYDYEFLDGSHVGRRKEEA